MEQLLFYTDKIQSFLWTYVVIVLLIGGALYCTWQLRGVQFTRVGEMLRMLFQSAQTDAEVQDHGGRRINSFQAFAVSLSSRVGTGNLAGVASAIAVGGPGAVFWMWVMALLGAGTAFVESVLAQLYKRKGSDSFYGGPAYYMQHGLHCRWMGILFAVCMIFGFGLANQVMQSNTLCDALGMSFSVAPMHVAVALTVMTLLIVFGGIQRISKFAALVVPFMALGYLALSVYICLANITQVPAMLALIVRSAFGIDQAVGGAFGLAVMQGIKRGLFSNEAGEGSTPNAAATATISHPVKQGLLQSLGVFTDTLVICSCSAFVILLSGLYDQGEDGILLTRSAMSHHLGSFGSWFLTAAIFLFAYTTIIANYFYGETNIRYITSRRWAVTVFRLVTGVVVLAGGYFTLAQAWSIVDLAMALMTIINMVALLLLSRHAFRLLRHYIACQREGRPTVFHRSDMPDIADDLEGWDDDNG
ncbi:MAG: alanine:cation symporter family protein [Bacteroidaceae bacterium]|nr:alanine:cation symporter family protein [Bacteroidaceae bacterium]